MEETLKEKFAKAREKMLNDLHDRLTKTNEKGEREIKYQHQAAKVIRDFLENNGYNEAGINIFFEKFIKNNKEINDLAVSEDNMVFAKKEELIADLHKEMVEHKISEQEYWDQYNKIMMSLGVGKRESGKTSRGGAANQLIHAQLRDLEKIKNKNMKQSQPQWPPQGNSIEIQQKIKDQLKKSNEFYTQLQKEERDKFAEIQRQAEEENWTAEDFEMAVDALKQEIKEKQIAFNSNCSIESEEDKLKCLIDEALRGVKNSKEASQVVIDTLTGFGYAKEEISEYMRNMGAKIEGRSETEKSSSSNEISKADIENDLRKVIDMLRENGWNKGNIMKWKEKGMPPLTKNKQGRYQYILNKDDTQSQGSDSLSLEEKFKLDLEKIKSSPATDDMKEKAILALEAKYRELRGESVVGDIEKDGLGDVMNARAGYKVTRFGSDATLLRDAQLNQDMIENDNNRSEILQILESQKVPEELQYSVSKISDLVGVFKNAEKNEHNYDQTKNSVDEYRQNIVEVSKNKVEELKPLRRSVEVDIEKYETKRKNIEEDIQRKDKAISIVDKYISYGDTEFPVVDTEKDKITQEELFSGIEWPVESVFVDDKLKYPLAKINDFGENINHLLEERRLAKSDQSVNNREQNRAKIEQYNKDIAHYVEMINNMRANVKETFSNFKNQLTEEKNNLNTELDENKIKLNDLKNNKLDLNEKINLFTAYIEEYGKDDWFEREVGSKEDLIEGYKDPKKKAQEEIDEREREQERIRQELEDAQTANAGNVNDNAQQSQATPAVSANANPVAAAATAQTGAGSNPSSIPNENPQSASSTSEAAPAVSSTNQAEAAGSAVAEESPTNKTEESPSSSVENANDTSLDNAGEEISSYETMVLERIQELKDDLSKVTDSLNNFPEGEDKVKLSLNGVEKEYTKEELEKLRDDLKAKIEFKEKDLELWKEKEYLNKKIDEIDALILNLDDEEKKVKLTLYGEEKEYNKKELLELRSELEEKRMEAIRGRLSLITGSIEDGTKKKDEEVKGAWGKFWGGISSAFDKFKSFRLVREWNDMSRARKMAWSLALGTTAIAGASIAAVPILTTPALVSILGKSAAIRATTMMGGLAGSISAGGLSSFLIDKDLDRLKKKQEKTTNQEEVKKITEAMSALERRRLGWVATFSAIGGFFGGWGAKTGATAWSDALDKEKWVYGSDGVKHYIDGKLVDDSVQNTNTETGSQKTAQAQDIKKLFDGVAVDGSHSTNTEMPQSTSEQIQDAPSESKAVETTSEVTEKASPENNTSEVSNDSAKAERLSRHYNDKLRILQDSLNEQRVVGIDDDTTKKLLADIEETKRKIDEINGVETAKSPEVSRVRESGTVSKAETPLTSEQIMANNLNSGLEQIRKMPSVKFSWRSMQHLLEDKFGNNFSAAERENIIANLEKIQEHKLDGQMISGEQLEKWFREDISVKRDGVHQHFGGVLEAAKGLSNQLEANIDTNFTHTGEITPQMNLDNLEGQQSDISTKTNTDANIEAVGQEHMTEKQRLLQEKADLERSIQGIRSNIDNLSEQSEEFRQQIKKMAEAEMNDIQANMDNSGVDEDQRIDELEAEINRLKSEGVGVEHSTGETSTIDSARGVLDKLFTGNEPVKIGDLELSLNENGVVDQHNNLLVKKPGFLAQLFGKSLEKDTLALIQNNINKNIG